MTLNRRAFLRSLKTKEAGRETKRNLGNIKISSFSI
jgi:hypothetical protein